MKYEQVACAGIAEIKRRVEEAVKYLNSVDLVNMPVGKYEVNEYFYFMVQENVTKKEEDCKFEWHRRHIDIQWIVSGEEAIDVDKLEDHEPMDEFNEVKDVQKLMPTAYPARTILYGGSYIILYPDNAHRPCIAVGEPAPVKKVVGKVLFD